MKSLASTLNSWRAGILAGCPKIDPELLARSRAARIGFSFIKAVYIARSIELVFMIVSVILLSAVEALAQQPSGNIFGSDQQVGNAIREAIKWGRNLLFLMGVVFVGWGVINYGTEKPAAKQFVAAIGCFAFGGIVALVYSISQGNAVNLDTGFGN
ncbi:MAG: hypothetical protein L0226_08890 [Acidobacteria bacterium]|nr:hypothetical protein [Acidobacteriota bacterium]